MDNTGKYVALANYNGHYQILKERSKENKVYDVVIPDAGYRRDLVLNIVDLLNSQGSEVGNVGSTPN